MRIGEHEVGPGHPLPEGILVPLHNVKIGKYEIDRSDPYFPVAEIIIVVLLFIGIVLFYSIIKTGIKGQTEQNLAWEQFTIEHCRVIAVENLKLIPPLRRNAKGQILNGSQIAYSCDDGVVYWKTK